MRKVAKLAVIGVLSAAPLMAADATAMPDPGASLTTLTTLAYNAGTLGGAILLWIIGRRLLGKLAK